MFSAGEGFARTHAHFKVTRPAEFSACDGNGHAKAKHKGEK
jgi:hypothetical protein